MRLGQVLPHGVETGKWERRAIGMIPLDRCSTFATVQLQSCRCCAHEKPDTTCRTLTDAARRLNQHGPRPARLAFGAARRALLAGAGYWGIHNLRQLDVWALAQARRVDSLITKAEQAVARVLDSPQTQELILRLPRWIPLRERLLTWHPLCRDNMWDHSQPPIMWKKTSMCRATPKALCYDTSGLAADAKPLGHTAELKKSPAQMSSINLGSQAASEFYSPHTHPVQGPVFSRRASAATASTAALPRVLDDESLTQLQSSPFSRRKAASRGSLTLGMATLDDCTLVRLASGEGSGDGSKWPVQMEETKTSRTASTASTNLHNSPPSDPLASLNPVIQSFSANEVQRNVDIFIHSVGNLFDSGRNPTADPLRHGPHGALSSSVHSCA